jgi:uncharacterized protein YidB (DUF937 family)
MSRSTPSLLALLGLVAVAGYQNRGKIGDMLKQSNLGVPPANPVGSPAGGGLLSGLGEMFQSGNLGSTLAGGLKELMGRFENVGQSRVVGSWVAPGPNLPVHPTDLENALGADTLAELEQKTGLGVAELLRRLSENLPDTVNALTPHGRPPTELEAQSLV